MREYFEKIENETAENFYNKVKSAFTSEVARKYFEVDRIMALLDDHRDGKTDNSRKIWTIYVFLVWYDVYFGE